MLALRAPDRGTARRRPQPGFPGLFPLRRFLTPARPVRCGGGGPLFLPRWRGGILPPSPRSPSPCSNDPPHSSTNASPTPDENEDRQSITEDRDYLSANGAKPRTPTK